jgi:hypothetical protein
MPLQANAQDVVPNTDEQRIDDLVIANHILFNQGVLMLTGMSAYVRLRIQPAISSPDQAETS